MLIDQLHGLLALRSNELVPSLLAQADGEVLATAHRIFLLAIALSLTIFSRAQVVVKRIFVELLALLLSQA